MPETIIVSDSILNQSTKTRAISNSVTISDGVVRVVARSVSKSLTENRPIFDVMTLRQTKQRIISDTVPVSELIEAFKNGIPTSVPPTEVPTPQNIIGTRERAIRIPRRAPRAIVIDEVSNTVTAPLKLLAFSDGINKAIVGIRPRLTQNVARVSLCLSIGDISLAQCGIKTSLQPIQVKARLALQSSSRSMWATALGRLKTRPELQTIESLKAINADRIDKLHKLAMLSMMVESL